MTLEALPSVEPTEPVLGTITQTIDGERITVGELHPGEAPNTTLLVGPDNEFLGAVDIEDVDDQVHFGHVKILAEADSPLKSPKLLRSVLGLACQEAGVTLVTMDMKRDTNLPADILHQAGGYGVAGRDANPDLIQFHITG